MPKTIEAGQISFKAQWYTYLFLDPIFQFLVFLSFHFAGVTF